MWSTKFGYMEYIPLFFNIYLVKLRILAILLTWSKYQLHMNNANCDLIWAPLVVREQHVFFLNFDEPFVKKVLDIRDRQNIPDSRGNQRICHLADFYWLVPYHFRCKHATAL